MAGHPESAGVVAEQLQGLPVEPQIEITRRAGVDDAPAFPIPRMRRHGRVELPVHQHGGTFPSPHPIHLRCHRDVPEPIKRQVRDDQDSLESRGDRCDVVHDNRAIEAPEDLLGGHSMVVRVVPEDPGRMVFRDLVAVLGGCSRSDSAKHVVARALWGHVKPMGVKVRRIIQPVGQRHRHGVSRPYPEGRSRKGTVISEGIDRRTADIHR